MFGQETVVLIQRQAEEFKDVKVFLGSDQNERGCKSEGRFRFGHVLRTNEWMMRENECDATTKRENSCDNNGQINV